MKLVSQWQNNKEKWVFYLLLIVFLYFFSYWTYHIFTAPLISCADFVNEASYLQLSWEQKSLFPVDYQQPHELLITRFWPIYWVAYTISHNFILSFQCMNIAGQLLMLAAIVYLMKQLKLRRTAIMLTLCLFWSLNAQREVLFQFPAYTAMVSCILLSLSSIIKIDNQWEQKDRFFQKSLWPHYVILVTLAAYFGFATFRLSAVFYIPFFLINGLYVLWKYTRKEQIEKRLLYLLVLSALLAAVAAVSYILCLKTCKAHFLPLSMTISNSFEWLTWDNLITQLRALLYALNLNYQSDLVSRNWPLFGLNILFVLFQLFAFYFTIRHGKNRHQKMIAALLCMTTILLFGMQLVGNTVSFSPRYYIATSVLSLLNCGICLSILSYKKDFKMVPSVLVVILLVAYRIFNPILYFDAWQNMQDNFIAIANYMENNGYQNVTASYWNSSPIKGYSNGAIENQHCYLMAPFEPFLWLIDASKFSDEQSGDPNILLLTDDEEEHALHTPKESLFITQYGQKVYEIGECNLYEFIGNPIVLFEEFTKDNRKTNAELPQDGQEQKTITPDAEGLLFAGAEFEDPHTLLSSGENTGFILYGPYQKAIEGTYDFVLHYEIVSQGDQQADGYFDVAIDAVQVASVNLEADSTSISIQNVRFNGGNHVFETRVFVPQGMIVRIQSLEYIRKE